MDRLRHPRNIRRPVSRIREHLRRVLQANSHHQHRAAVRPLVKHAQRLHARRVYGLQLVDDDGQRLAVPGAGRLGRAQQRWQVARVANMLLGSSALEVAETGVVPGASAVKVRRLAELAHGGQRSPDAQEQIDFTLQQYRVHVEPPDVGGRFAPCRLRCELPPQLRLADTRNADDERHAGARIARLAQPPQALAQGRKFVAATSEVRWRVALRAQLGRSGIHRKRVALALAAARDWGVEARQSPPSRAKC